VVDIEEFDDLKEKVRECEEYAVYVVPEGGFNPRGWK
jgi:hypothetical protein